MEDTPAPPPWEITKRIGFGFPTEPRGESESDGRESDGRESDGRESDGREYPLRSNALAAIVNENRGQYFRAKMAEKKGTRR